MSTVYLYIPFKEEEDSKELKDIVKRWHEHYEGKEIAKEVYADEGYKEKKIKIVQSGKDSFSDFQPNDKIYVISHGMKDTTEVGNSAINSTYVLSQKEVVLRMIDDGLPENTPCTIKLYYCDESHNAHQRADEFFNVLNSEPDNKKYSSAQIQYYPDVILGTMKPAMEEQLLPDKILKAHKSGYKVLTIIDADSAELNTHYKDFIELATKEELLEHLVNLNKKDLMTLLIKLDPFLVGRIQKKANISDPQKFLSAAEKRVSAVVILKNLGKPKKLRKAYESKAALKPPKK